MKDQYQITEQSTIYMGKWTKSCRVMEWHTGLNIQIDDTKPTAGRVKIHILSGYVKALDSAELWREHC